MTTIKDIARIAGVSGATVSRVLNQASNVKPETRIRVQETISGLNYYPNSLARGMRSKKTNSIGLLLADITNPFYAETAKTIIEVAGRHNYSIILCTTNNDLVEQKKYIDLLLQRRVDGFIFASVHSRDPSLEAVFSSGLPCILYNRKVEPSENVNYVVLDNEQGAYMAVRHLYSLGHRRIALIRGPHVFSTGRERENGYIKALKDYGLKYDETIVVQGMYSERQSYDAAIKLLKADNPPTAIFASNDLMALSALDAVISSGLKVPGDISIVGFDDIEIASHSAIQLTSLLNSAYDALGVCMFGYVARSLVPLDNLLAAVRGVTGWKTSMWEILKVGERALAMGRIFNFRQGLTADDDRLPDIFYTSLEKGPYAGKATLQEKKFGDAVGSYYDMAGWSENGSISKGKLEELGLSWVEVLGDECCRPFGPGNSRQQ